MSPAALTPAQKIFTALGVVIICATWIVLVLVRPLTWDVLAGPALITLGGYGAGTILLLAAALPHLPARTYALIPVALVLNIVIGQLVGSFSLPIYLDTIGTVLVAVLAGPLAGATTGALSSVVWGLFNPLALPFVAGSALTGLLAGWASRKGWFSRWLTVIPVGLILGIITGAVAAPVAAFVYGGTAGVGTGALVLLFREMGQSLIGAVTTQAFLSDPLDKLIVCLLVVAVVKALPQRQRVLFAAK